ncbi:SMI1/KNR4 family protein [Achromobacter sp. UMC71]|uniref:SMI1/KNR4 family protein n=1 Tax=Achromobacter sp. UMC71 TaxID=1862320 RepID=UPI0016014A5F|nr:SMI1/KNR4 family protein [Achromobacter sp. UMC71]MBB1625913.1 hypothetical protein [Achromobacter sp. UMC71]
MEPLEQFLRSGKILQSFPGADSAAIQAYEQTWNTRLSDSYKAFLARSNGLRFGFDFDEAHRAGVSPALADMNTFFGIGNGSPHLDLALLTPKMRFHNPAFLPFAPVLGLGGDFCTYVEISQGKHLGRIMYTDGEMTSIYEDLDIRGQDVDALIDGFIDDGWFMPVAASFDDLIRMYAKMA